MAKKAKLPADTNRRAKSIVDLATGQGEDTGLTTDGKNSVVGQFEILGSFLRTIKSTIRISLRSQRIVRTINLYSNQKIQSVK
jgi:hypothetical protein